MKFPPGLKAWENKGFEQPSHQGGEEVGTKKGGWEEFKKKGERNQVH